MVAERDVKVGDLLIRYGDGTPAVVLEITEDLQIRGYAHGSHLRVHARPRASRYPRKQYRLWTEGCDVWVKESSLNVHYYRA
jgi:hypothetical protein